MSRKSTWAISSSISFLTSAGIWIHMEMPDATILSSRLPRVERKARPPCAGIFGVQRPRRAGGHAALVISGLVATFALIELAKFLRSVLRSSEILLQNDAMLRQAVRAPT